MGFPSTLRSTDSLDGYISHFSAHTSTSVNSVKMEPPETETENYPTCVDPALRILEQLFEGQLFERHGYRYHEDFRTTTLLEFRFFKLFFWGLDHWQVSGEYDWHLHSVTSTVGPKLRQTVEEFQFHVECVDGPQIYKTWKQRLDQLEKRIQPFKRLAKEICILSLGGEIRCKPCHQDLELFLEYGRETAAFIEFFLDNLQALNSKYHLIATAKQQIDLITGKLKVFRKFANPVSHSITRVKNLGELISQTRTWANHLSCLACLYWIDRMDESLASTAGTMRADLMQKTISCTRGVVASYFKDAHFPQILASYIDFLLEEFVMPSTKDNIKTLLEGLIFLLSFMTDPPEEDSEDRKLILGQIYSIINELPSLICSIHSNEIFETKLSDFLQKISGVVVEVRQLYAITPRSAQFNSPRTNAMGFLDSLLQKLKEWPEGEVNFVALGKRDIQTVWEELESLRPFVQHLAGLQIEREELKDLWTRIVNLVYHSAYVTSLCAAKSFSIWYGIICLPSVIEEVKVIKNEVREIKVREINDPQMCKSKMLESRNTVLPRATTSKVEGAFIGFKEDTESIINHLIRGPKDLTIISISGMAGQGKTTLAKRIYNDPKIQYHFDKTLWCNVSKECKIRDLIVYLVRDGMKNDVEDISKLEMQDLAEKLRKNLKGKTYLIVMDDIWDVRVWCEVQSSFPDDTIGSRILFTSRNHNLKSSAERNFIPYPLRLFSEVESWDLMKEKVSHYNGLGPEFEVIGKEIAKSCNGLPLAVALVASLLGKTEQKLELWNQVAENLKSHLANEGCMHILELSYKYLPEHLKSCFLYFGAFPRGENVRAKRLKLLWIAEGFIKGNSEDLAGECLDYLVSQSLAGECLDYLVSQSLVVVAERSSMGRIKTCNVHDLLYDLCLKEIAEDNFLHFIDWSTFDDECCSSPPKYGHHRLCIGERDPLIEARPICRRKELPTSLAFSLLWSDRVLASDSDGGSFNFPKSFKVLTVLDLENVKLKGDVFPEVILCNNHLKYLALWGRFEDIPTSIAELWNLETLILKEVGYANRNVPDAMWRMKSLRHVRIDGGCLFLEDLEGNESYSAAQHNIETLCGVEIEDDSRTLKLLRRMKRLRKLKFRSKADTLNRILFIIFRFLKSLEELKIVSYSAYGGSVFETGCISSLPQNKNLRKLSLMGLTLPSWGAMSTIGKQLPNLEVLKLWQLSSVGRWDLKDGEFSKLRYLRLWGLDDLEEINVSVCENPSPCLEEIIGCENPSPCLEESIGCENPFPCLEEFIVMYCGKLKEIPCSFGYIGSLNTIKMSKCSPQASESVKQILQEQRDLGNHSLQVFVTDIWELTEEDTWTEEDIWEWTEEEGTEGEGEGEAEATEEEGTTEGEGEAEATIPTWTRRIKRKH